MSTRMGNSGGTGRMSLIVQLGAVVATALEEVGGASQHDTVVEVSTGLGAGSSEPEEVFQKNKTTSKYPGSCGLPYQFVLQDHNYGAPPPPTPPMSPTANRQGDLDGPSSVNNRTSSVPEATLGGVALKLDRGDDEDSRGSGLSSPRHGIDGEPEEGEETETAPEGEEEDDSVTRCICNFEHDDGYMICCDKCFVWQHVDCMGIDRSNIPDEYQCERCQPRRVDRTRARALQLRKREELSHHHSDSSSFSSSSSSRSPVPPTYSLTNGPNSGTSGENVEESMTNRRKRRTSASSSLAAARAKAMTENKRGAGMKRKKQDAPREQIPNNSMGVTSPQSQSKETSSRSSSTSQRPVRSRKRRDSMKGAEYKRASAKRRGKAAKSIGSEEVMGDEETQDSWEVGNPSGSGAVQLRRWIDNYEEAVTNHYSPELRARLSAIRVNGVHSGLNNTNGLGSLNISSHHSSASKCRVTQLEPGIRALVASSYLHSNQIVIEIRGKYMLGTQHRQQPSIAKRYPPFLFFYELPKDGTEVCVDARTYGNAARFIRRSCRPNAEVRHCIEKGVLHLYIVTNSNIDKNAEITILHESHHQHLDAHGHLICACNSKDCTAPAPYKRNGFVETERDRRRRGRRTISSEGDTTEPPTPPINPIQPTVPHSIPRKGPKSPTKVQTVAQAAPSPHPQNVQEDSSDATRVDSDSVEVSNKKKLTREERKMEAIMKAFERLEKAEQRRQEVLARQAQRKEQDVGPADSGRARREEDAVAAAVVAAAAAVASKRREDEEDDDDEKTDGLDGRHSSSILSERPRRKGRKGRGRSSAPQRRNSRVQSGDGESDLTSADEGPTFSSSTTPLPSSEVLSVNSLPVATSNSVSSVPVPACPSPSPTSPSPSSSSVPWPCENATSPAVNQQLPISNLPFGSHSPINNIAFAGPLTPGFKFPKTKKVLMNEWLNKGPSETVSVAGQSLPTLPSTVQSKPEVNTYSHSAVVGLGPTGLLPLSTGRESLACALVAAAIGSPLSGVSPGTVSIQETGVGSAKKRWLRQAIRDETDSPAGNACCSPNSRAGSPPCTAGDYVTPLKKRRLARESMSSEQSFTPPTTPVGGCENEAGNNSSSPPPSNDSKMNASSKAMHESIIEQEEDEEEEYDEEEEEEEEEDGAAAGEVVESASADNTQAQSGDERCCANEEGDGEVCDESDKDKVIEAMELLVFGTTEMPSNAEEVITDSETKEVIQKTEVKVEDGVGRTESNVYSPKESDNILGSFRKNGISHKEFPDVKESTNQPATKRKLSISEYRKRKLRASGDEKVDIKSEKEAYGSPPLPRSADTNSEVDHFSIKEECKVLSKPVPSILEGSDYEKKGSEEKSTELCYSRWNSAPTLVERQRENLTERLKREFGLCVGEEEEQERLRKHLGIPEVVDKVLGKDTGSEAKLSSRMLVAQALAAPPPPPKSPPSSNVSAPVIAGQLVVGARTGFSPIPVKGVQIPGTSPSAPAYPINGGGPSGIPVPVGTSSAGVGSYVYQGVGLSCVPSVALPPPPPPFLPPQYHPSTVHPFGVPAPNSSSPVMIGRPSRAPGQAVHLGASSAMPTVTASAGLAAANPSASGNIIVSPSIRSASKTFFGQGFLPSRT